MVQAHRFGVARVRGDEQEGDRRRVQHSGQRLGVHCGVVKADRTMQQHTVSVSWNGAAKASPSSTGARLTSRPNLTMASLVRSPRNTRASPSRQLPDRSTYVNSEAIERAHLQFEGGIALDLEALGQGLVFGAVNSTQLDLAQQRDGRLPTKPRFRVNRRAQHRTSSQIGRSFLL